MADERSKDTRVRHITRLPREVVERIAAGEVIERPASVVRELVGNALDAGASSVRIAIREGGLRLISVADDGCGIPTDELELACQPHTTSKIGQIDDLDHITTFGFRGEALASIAAMAELEVESAMDDGGLAATIILATDSAATMGIASRSRGTTVTVRDLFQQVPARRALLRGPRSEAQRVQAVVRAHALAHPDVQFTLTDDGFLLLQTAGSDLRAAVASIYGIDVANALLTLGPSEAGGVSIRGAVAARAFHYATREQVLVTVNGRPVGNATLLAAAEAGYRPLLRKGRHPLLVAALAVDPTEVDANVHPAKAEVLLRQERTAAAALREAVHGALGSAPLSIPASTGLPSAPHFTRPLQLSFPAQRHRRGLRIREPGIHYLGDADDEVVEDESGELPRLLPLGQFDSMLILAQSPTNHLFLVDQHRAHERILYEELLKQRDLFFGADQSSANEADPDVRSGPGQLMLEPLLVELTPLQAELLLPRLEELRAIGFACQPFGGNVYLVRAVPHLSGMAGDPGAFARDFANEAAEDSNTWLDHVCTTIACRTAIRRGQPLTLSEQHTLLTDLRQTKAPMICPHGSPLVLRYTRQALAKAFEW
ncbi:MAG TPA: DNA mismatch repair endonuclease MutL [Ktedonobacterales bacterium]|nr:DNA mismatch repair endonuclease MutL [Ktedonobacterales bacterium]